MYYDEFGFHRGPSVDDDPTLTGPAGERSASAQGGQESQNGPAPRMHLNGQSPRTERQAYDPYRQGGSYERSARARTGGPSDPRKTSAAASLTFPVPDAHPLDSASCSMAERASGPTAVVAALSM